MTKKIKIKTAVTIIAILAFTVHLIFPKLTLDTLYIALLVVAIDPWLEYLFKSVELPEGIKLEFQELQKLGKMQQRQV